MPIESVLTPPLLARDKLPPGHEDPVAGAAEMTPPPLLGLSVKLQDRSVAHEVSRDETADRSVEHNVLFP